MGLINVQVIWRAITYKNDFIGHHPNTNNILYVNLERLADDDTQAGELAGVLLGITKTPKDPLVNSIFEGLLHSFDIFKADKEARNHMTRRELYEARGEARLKPLIKEKDELLQKAEEEKGELRQKAKDDKLDSAKSMLLAGLPAAAVSEHLKLSIDVVENLS